MERRRLSYGEANICVHVVSAWPLIEEYITALGMSSQSPFHSSWLNVLDLSQCQIESWKQGRPTPHREICGKTANVTSEAITAPHASTPSGESSARIPDPDPTFERSPALEHQISFLRQPPYVDYTVCLNHRMVGVLWAHDEILQLSSSFRILCLIKV